MLWVLGIMTAATFASCLKPTAGWPLPTGLGGTLGDALLRLPGLALGWPLSDLDRIAIAGVTGLMSLLLLLAAAGFRLRLRLPRRAPASDRLAQPDDFDDDAPVEKERGWLLGWFAHALLSARARVARLAARALRRTGRPSPPRRRGSAPRPARGPGSPRSGWRRAAQWSC